MAAGSLTPDTPPLARPPPRLAVVGLHAAAATVVLAGLVAVSVQPVVPAVSGVPAPSAFFGAEHLEEVRSYRDPRYLVAVGALGLRLAVVLAVAGTRVGARLTARVTRRFERWPAAAAALVVVGTVAAADLVALPLSFWAGHVHEQAFGFRTQGALGWLADHAVVAAIAWLVVGLLVIGGYTLARRLAVLWVPVAGLAAAGVTVLAVFASPLIVEPLLLDTAPLPPGPLRSEVDGLLERAGHADADVVVADASRRTTKRNAYVSGLGASRHVVLYDTLVAAQPPAEVALVLAHELGHARNGDLLRGTVMGAAAAVTTVYLLALVVRWRQRRGLQHGVADPRGAAAVLATVVVLQVVTAPLQNALSRRTEHAADVAALQLTQAPDVYLRNARELAEANLSDPAPPWWARALFATHPPPHVRLEVGRRFEDGRLEGRQR